MAIGKEIVAIFFVAIVLGLILKNGNQTVAVIKAIGDQATAATKQLQGG